MIFLPGTLEKFQVFSKMEPNVAILRFFPGITVSTLEAFLAPQIKGIVLQTYGAGNGPDSRMDLINCLRKACEREVLIVNITQCQKGYVSDVYATGRVLTEAGIVPGGDMTPECALAKIAYVLGHEDWSFDVKKAMILKNIRGERYHHDVKTRFEFGDQSFLEALARSMNAYGPEMQFMKDAIYPVVMCRAAADGCLDLIQKFASEGASVNGKDYEGRTPLHVSCAFGKLEVVEFLLNHGALVHQLDRHGNNAMVDALRGEHFEIVKLLKQAGGTLPPTFPFASSLCQIAASGEVSRMQMYIEAGCDINVADYDERTPLILSVFHHRYEMVKYILSLPLIDLSPKDTFEKDAYTYAKEKGYVSIRQLLKKLRTEKEKRREMKRRK